MKYLLVLMVIAVAIWHWRRGRRETMREQQQQKQRQARPPQRPRAATTLAPPQAMLRCAHCGLHLPATDALRGAGGVYCSAAHRQAAEPQPQQPPR